MRRQGMYRTQEERARAIEQERENGHKCRVGLDKELPIHTQPDVSGRRVWSDALRPNAEGVHRTMKANNYGK